VADAGGGRRAVALVPVKELAFAKERLSPVLEADERQYLSLAMFFDVLYAALNCPSIESVSVVTRDANVAHLARDAGAHALEDPGDLNAALTSASRSIARGRATRLIVLGADIPLATPDAIDSALASDVDVALVPAEDGGTNALAMPPEVIPFLFGRDSARRHLDAARAAGLRTASIDIPELQLDIDTPDDLERLSAILPREHSAARTTEALRELGLLHARAER
jgi:2-phospho-L-lactate/phosphoenolpyruvate guanylyltransferase